MREYKNKKMARIAATKILKAMPPGYRVEEKEARYEIIHNEDEEVADVFWYKIQR